LSAGHSCELRDVADFHSPSDVAHLVSQNPPFEAALAIHLFKAGRLLLVMSFLYKVSHFLFALDLRLPFGVIFGGTDINEDVKDEQKRVVMEQVLLKARFAVAFTEKLKEEAEFVLCLDELRVFLLVCGLRRVKDPLYLADVFSEWHSENLHNVLIIIGPKVSRDLAPLRVDCDNVILKATGVFLAQERSQQELHAAMKRCFAVVNSSVSEGMSAAILEAMDLRVPVLARNIPGNASVVKHGVTGLLFSSPQEFMHQSQRLLSDQELRERVVRSGKLYVEEHHTVKQERETYQRLVDKLHKAQFSA
uniref:Glycosyltransferase 1 domain containing 1 n=1 Tax=Poecilia latipinna TaxID=48699 RepID=A0A3B3VXP5_9TELE